MQNAVAAVDELEEAVEVAVGDEKALVRSIALESNPSALCLCKIRERVREMEHGIILILLFRPRLRLLQLLRPSTR